LYWLQKGAQPSQTVRKLLQISGAWAEFTGEAPPKPVAGSKKTTAASVKATPAASVEEPADVSDD
jgi:ribosomal protein S16